MQITFAGIVIVQEADFGGFDSAQGFDPDSTPVTDWSEPLRAPFGIPIDRSITKTTISGTLLRPPEGSLAAALTAKALMFQRLPRQGDLIIQLDALQPVTWSNAARGPGRTLKTIHGLSWGYEMTFHAGQASSPTIVSDSAGGDLTDSTGTSITP